MRKFAGGENELFPGFLWLKQPISDLVGDMRRADHFATPIELSLMREDSFGSSLPFHEFVSGALRRTRHSKSCILTIGHQEQGHSSNEEFLSDGPFGVEGPSDLASMVGNQDDLPRAFQPLPGLDFLVTFAIAGHTTTPARLALKYSFPLILL